MFPASSVSGYLLAHTGSHYFAVDRPGRNQVADYGGAKECRSTTPSRARPEPRVRGGGAGGLRERQVSAPRTATTAIGPSPSTLPVSTPPLSQGTSIAYGPRASHGPLFFDGSSTGKPARRDQSSKEPS